MKTIFLETFGDTPVLRILDFLVVNEDFDYSMTDIAKHSSVGYATLKLFWKNLLVKDIIIQTRYVGKAKMYKLNYENPVVNKFRELYWLSTKNTINQKISQKRRSKAILFQKPL
jgi:hypothetical protein